MNKILLLIALVFVISISGACSKTEKVEQVEVMTLNSDTKSKENKNVDFSQGYMPLEGGSQVISVTIEPEAKKAIFGDITDEEFQNKMSEIISEGTMIKGNLERNIADNILNLKEDSEKYRFMIKVKVENMEDASKQ